MANFTPASVFPEYASNGLAMIFPIKNFASLTPGLADAEYGDVREIFRSFIEKGYEFLFSLPPEEKPTNFAIDRTNSEMVGDMLQISYTVTYSLAIRSEDLTLASTGTAVY